MEKLNYRVFRVKSLDNDVILITDLSNKKRIKIVNTDKEMCNLEFAKRYLESKGIKTRLDHIIRYDFHLLYTKNFDIQL